MRTALIAGLLALVAVSAHATTPLPAKGDHAVYDAASVIDASTRSQLEALAAQLVAQAGVAIVVVTVPRLDGETIDQLAVRVQHDWGVGAKGKDESVVIALSVADHKIFIATGYGSEGYLPDGKVGEIRDRARTLLHAGDYSTGVRQIAQDVATIAATAHHITLDDSVRNTTTAPRSGCGAAMPVFAFIGMFVLFALLNRRGGGGGGGGGGLLSGLAFLSMFGRGGGGGGGSSGGEGGFGGFGGGSGGGGGAGGDF